MTMAVVAAKLSFGRVKVTTPCDRWAGIRVIPNSAQKSSRSPPIFELFC
jgi:hypothetical protein